MVVITAELNSMMGQENSTAQIKMVFSKFGSFQNIPQMSNLYIHVVNW